FRSSAQFDKARECPSERSAPVGTPELLPRPILVGGGQPPLGGGGGRPPAPEGFEPCRAALLVLAKTLDAQDPKLEKTITEDEFTRRVGPAPVDAIVQVARYGNGDEDLS